MKEAKVMLGDGRVVEASPEGDLDKTREQPGGLESRPYSQSSPSTPLPICSQAVRVVVEALGSVFAIRFARTFRGCLVALEATPQAPLSVAK